MKKYLIAIYEYIFEESPLLNGVPFADYSSRFKMQKAVYLLSELGHFEGYMYFKGNRGMYSQTLTNELVEAEESVFEFTERAKISMDKVKDIWKRGENTPYDVGKWLDCVSLVHYMASTMRTTYIKENILEKLMDTDSELFDIYTNKLACDVVVEYWNKDARIRRMIEGT